MNKKLEITKLKYDNAKMWLIAILAMFVSFSIGFFSTSDSSYKPLLGDAFFITLMGFVILFLIFIDKYNKLLKFYKQT